MKKKKSHHYSSPKRKKDILSAALSCFMEHGFNNTSISDVCDRAGVSVGSLYHHFGSKERLAIALYLEGIRSYQRGLLLRIARCPSAKKGIQAIVKFHLTWVDNNRDWAGFLFNQRHAAFMGSTEGELKKLNMEFFDEVASWLKSKIETRELRSMTPDLFTPMLLGPCQEYSRAYLEGRSVATLDDAAKKIGEAVWFALRSNGDSARKGDSKCTSHKISAKKRKS
jgi:AcrR family transcriptional regulator